jgi:hypothetical protein
MMAASALANAPESRLVGSVEHIAQIEDRLAASRSVIEREFEDMGARLSDCVRLLNEVSATHADTAAALESEEFKAATRQLQDMRDRIGELVETHSGSHDYLNHLAGMASAVRAPLSDLSRTVRAIGIVAINARIAAAALSVQDEDFAVFTTGMSTLAMSVADVVKALSASYNDLSSSLAKARTANADLSARQGNTVNQISERLGDHLSVLDSHNVRAAAKSVEYAQLVRQITGRVAAAVSALQIGDITRQRIEHVEQALAMLRMRVGEGVDDGKADPVVSVVCCLQAAQLEDAIPDFDGRILDLATTLRALASDTSALLKDSNNAADAMLASGGTALAAMVDEQHRLQAMFKEVRATRASLAGVADNVTQTFAVMAGHIDAVRKIEKDMRMVSLNTTIQCGRLGDQGRTLSVIAEELKDLTSDTVTAASGIMAALGEADEFVRQSTAEQSGGDDADINALESDASSATELIEAVISRTRDAVTDVGRQAPKVIGLIEDAVKSVNSRGNLSDNWRRAQKELEMYALSDAKPAENGGAGEILAEMRSRYTMDSERNVHDHLLGSSAENVADAAGDAGIDDLLF